MTARKHGPGGRVTEVGVEVFKVGKSGEGAETEPAGYAVIELEVAQAGMGAWE